MRLFSLICLFLFLAPLQAEQIPAEAFAEHPQYQRVKISPDGRFLAVTAPLKGRYGLVVIDLKSRKITAGLNFGGDEEVSDFWWVGPDRVMATPVRTGGAFSNPRSTGELFAIDADGRNRDYLFGVRGEQQVGSHLGSTRANANATVIDPLPDDPRHALIAVNERSHSQFKDNELFATIELIDVQTGRRKKQTSSPIRGYPSYLADPKGLLRYVIGRDENYRLHSFFRLSADSDWIETGFDDSVDLRALEFSRDGQRAYLASSESNNTSCLIEHRLADNSRHTLACDPIADLDRLIMSFDGNQPVAAVFASGRPRLELINKNHADSKLLAKLDQAFPGQFAYPVSQTLDGSKAVVGVFSDRNPGDFFLFDTRSLQAEYIESSRPWIDPESMGRRIPFKTTARDGTRLHGFLTVPAGTKPGKLPAVVLVHGGPFGHSDSWTWDAEAQFLASRGYAVIQVNFRGSGAGYGRKFEEAGRYGWGKAMIDDLTDTTRWMSAQGHIDPKRVCIAGASYGGYAALMSAVREPDLYRCVAGYAGVYDLESWSRESDVSETGSGESYIERWVGRSDAELRAQSPLALIDRLRAPVLIVHGGLDERVPVSQAQALRAALRQRDHAHEWLLEPREAHGFHDEEARSRYLRQLEAFLAKHL